MFPAHPKCSLLIIWSLCLSFLSCSFNLTFSNTSPNRNGKCCFVLKIKWLPLIYTCKQPNLFKEEFYSHFHCPPLLLTVRFAMILFPSHWFLKLLKSVMAIWLIYPMGTLISITFWNIPSHSFGSYGITCVFSYLYFLIFGFDFWFFCFWWERRNFI